MVKRFVAGIVTAGLMLALLGGGMVVTASGDAGSSGKSGKFKPKQFKGAWKGKWNNKTFKTTGAATMKLKVKGKGKKQQFIGTFDLGGNAFGCPDPAPRTVKMKKGNGANSWNSKGFKVSYDNGQGPVKLTYKHKKQKFSGSGTSPCTPTITYTYDGKMTTKKVTADVEIFNGGTKFAKSTLSVKKK